MTCLNFLLLSSVLFITLHSTESDFSSSCLRYGKSSWKCFEDYPNLALERYFPAKLLYEKNINRTAKIHGNIPKIIHQIWIGETIPESLLNLSKCWQNWTGWQYILWSEDAILSLDFADKDLFIKSSCPAEKADIARLEILKKYGGVYVDLDYECTNPESLKLFCDNYDIFLGLEPLEHELKIGNAFIAAAPNHPAINLLLKKLRGNYFSHEDECATIKTGPNFITSVLLQGIDTLSGGVLLPPTYLFPLSAKFTEFLHIDSYKASETLGVHYWVASWFPVSRWENIDIVNLNKGQ